jgi:hypothetical protein
MFLLAAILILLLVAGWYFLYRPGPQKDPGIYPTDCDSTKYSFCDRV